MVNSSAQLFTIEGLAAAMIMILTVFFVVNTTSVYTPGDTHISDMQLEILGSDALRMMDIPDSHRNVSPLRMIIENDQSERFSMLFSNYTNNRTLQESDYIKFNATYTCRNTADDKLVTYPIAKAGNLTGTEHPVRLTKWVRVNTPVCGPFAQDRAVLVEVYVWRD